MNWGAANMPCPSFATAGSALRDDVLYHHGAGALALPPQSCVRLLVELQRPRQAEPDKGGATGLQVDAVTGRGRMDDRYRDFAAVPVGDVLAGFQLTDIEALFDALQVVTEPVGHQYGLAIGGFDDVLQRVQLPVMELYRIAGIGIDSAVGELGQFPGQGRCVGSSHLAIRELQDESLFELLVPVGLCVREVDLISGGYELRHLQVVGGFHGNRDVRNPAVDGVLRSRHGLVGVDDLSVAFVREEEGVPILCDEASEALTHIQQPELGPQIHEAVGGRGAGQSDDALDLGSDAQQSFKSLGLVILERGQLVNDHGIVVKGKTAALDEPAQVLSVDDGDVGADHQGGPPLSGAAYGHGIGQLFQMRPFLDFRRPGVAGHP